MKKLGISIICLFCFLSANAQYLVSSPDTKVRVSLQSKKTRNINTKMMTPSSLRLSVSANRKMVVENKEADIVIYSHGHRKSFGKSNITELSVTQTPIVMEAEGIDEPLAQLSGKCNRMLLQTDAGIAMELLVFNDGVAYRYSVSGVSGEYKILNVNNLFPEEKANAILGTFSGDKVLPWRVMRLNDARDKAEIVDDWETIYPSRKVVTWRDALSSVSVGITINWLSGNTWRKPSQSHGVYADLVYKHLYGGISFTPCHELMYIFWGNDYEPFKNVMGSIHSWDMTGRFGYHLPVQIGANVWSFAPYASATYLALRQHYDYHNGYSGPHPGFSKLSNKNHCLLGLGLKMQFMLPERISMGVAYEYQFFTGSNEPNGRNTLIFTIGIGL